MAALNQHLKKKLDQTVSRSMDVSLLFLFGVTKLGSSVFPLVFTHRRKLSLAPLQIPPRLNSFRK